MIEVNTKLLSYELNSIAHGDIAQIALYTYINCNEKCAHDRSQHGDQLLSPHLERRLQVSVSIFNREDNGRETVIAQKTPRRRSVGLEHRKRAKK